MGGSTNGWESSGADEIAEGEVISGLKTDRPDPGSLPLTALVIPSGQNVI